MLSYKRLIYGRFFYHRSMNLIGLLIAISIFSCETTYKIIKFIIKTTYNLIKKIIRYIKFAKSEYSYTEVESIINNMSGREFERLCYNLFKELGDSKVKLTPPNRDGGKDIILYSNKKGYTYIECKRWNDDFKIGRPEIQKLIGAGVPNNIENYIFITTGKYSAEAIKYSKSIDNLELWNMNDIMYLVMKIRLERIPILMMKSLDNNTKILRLKPIPY